MAFRILNENELLLLTEEQTKQYERELDLYQKRAAFVEQLEKYESAEIKPFQPKLDFVAPAVSPDIAPYHQREYKVKLQEPCARPEVQLRFTKLETASEPELPSVSVNTVKSRKICEIENPAPILPVFHRLPKLDIHVREPDIVHAELPETRQAHLSDIGQICMEKVHVHISETAPRPPKMAAVPENLPADFRKSVVSLPAVAMPRPNFPDLGTLPEQRHLKLPDVPTEVKVQEAAALPELHISALPVVQKPEIRGNRKFAEIKIDLQKMVSFHVPEVKAVTFIQPDTKPHGLPVTGKMRVKAPVLNPLQPIQVKKAEPPAVKSAAVRQICFHAVSVDISPGAAVKIPDAYTALAEFFKKNTKKKQ